MKEEPEASIQHTLLPLLPAPICTSLCHLRMLTTRRKMRLGEAGRVPKATASGQRLRSSRKPSALPPCLSDPRRRSCDAGRKAVLTPC